VEELILNFAKEYGLWAVVGIYLLIECKKRQDKLQDRTLEIIEKSAEAQKILAIELAGVQSALSRQQQELIRISTTLTSVTMK